MQTGKKLFFLCLILSLAASAALFACGDDDDDNDNDTSGETDDDTGGADDDDSGASCTQEDLCSQAIACGAYEGSTEDCVSDAAQGEAECADYEALMVCNCECYDNETDCTEFMNCGTECINTYCTAK